jgi:hypothetical protein
LDKVDDLKVVENLKNLLDIKDKKEQKVEIRDAYRIEIKEYLDILDLTIDIETRWMSDYNRSELRTVFSQPGMRYSQAKALITTLMRDDRFRDISLNERNRIISRILDEIKGRMMEDIVLLETKLSKHNFEVFKLQFAVGEVDMVIFNPAEGCCELYEIKHSKEVVDNQCRHLLDESKCKDIEFRYGTIKRRSVIYRGESMVYEKDAAVKVEYLNVEEYLKSL